PEMALAARPPAPELAHLTYRATRPDPASAAVCPLPRARDPTDAPRGIPGRLLQGQRPDGLAAEHLPRHLPLDRGAGAGCGVLAGVCQGVIGLCGRKVSPLAQELCSTRVAALRHSSLCTMSACFNFG